MDQGTDRWRVGVVTVTQIVERHERSIPPQVMVAGLEPDHVRTLGWLQPHYADEAGMLHFSIHAFVIETGERRIVVDTCIGNHKARSHPDWHGLEGSFLESFEAAGFPADSIDTVLCTHLHIDHVGWNTRRVGDHWVPTFPKARYLFGRVEWDHWRQEAKAAQADTSQPFYLLDVTEVMADSVQPIVDAGLHELVESDHRLTDEVSLIPTPGHTPGHVSVLIRSHGQEAVITGDLLHHPVQMAVPDHGSPLNSDAAAASETRRAFLTDHADRDTLVLGTHFPSPSGGHVRREGDAWRFAPYEGNRA